MCVYVAANVDSCMDCGVSGRETQQPFYLNVGGQRYSAFFIFVWLVAVTF